MRSKRLITFLFALAIPVSTALAAAPSLDDRAVDYIALVRAAAADDMTSVQTLIRRGTPLEWKLNNPNDLADFNAGTSDTPLSAAAAQGAEKMVLFLLKHGADPNREISGGRTALYQSIVNKHVSVVRLLLEGGADPTIPYGDLGSALELAQEVGDKQIIDLVAQHMPKPVNRN